MSDWHLPRLFIGGSSEAQNVIESCVELLQGYAKCVPWYTAPEFSDRGSITTFNALYDATFAYDFALFLLTPDDALNHRNSDYKCPRDNVIYEMGLFIGALGPERVCAILQRPEGTQVKLPSDVAGVNIPRFSYAIDGQLDQQTSLKSAVQGLAGMIKRSGFRTFQLSLAKDWGYNSKDRQFEVVLQSSHLASNKAVIEGYDIALAARVKVSDPNFEDDDSIVFSTVRALPAPLNDMVLTIGRDQFPRGIPEDADIQGRILLVPKGLPWCQFRTVKEAVGSGCRDVERVRAST